MGLALHDRAQGLESPGGLWGSPGLSRGLPPRGYRSGRQDTDLPALPTANPGRYRGRGTSLFFPSRPPENLRGSRPISNRITADIVDICDSYHPTTLQYNVPLLLFLLL